MENQGIIASRINFSLLFDILLEKSAQKKENFFHLFLKRFNQEEIQYIKKILSNKFKDLTENERKILFELKVSIIVGSREILEFDPFFIAENIFEN